MQSSVIKRTIDLQKRESQFTIFCKQNDTKRKLILKILDDRQTYWLDNVNATIYGEKPDGTIIFNTCDIEDNCVVYNITSQTLAAIGTVVCELEISNDNGDILSTPKFNIDVVEKICTDSAIESTNELTKLQKIINDINNVETLNNKVDSLNYINKYSKLFTNDRDAYPTANAVIENTTVTGSINAQTIDGVFLSDGTIGNGDSYEGYVHIKIPVVSNQWYHIAAWGTSGVSKAVSFVKNDVILNDYGKAFKDRYFYINNGQVMIYKFRSEGDYLIYDESKSIDDVPDYFIINNYNSENTEYELPTIEIVCEPIQKYVDRLFNNLDQGNVTKALESAEAAISLAEQTSQAVNNLNTTAVKAIQLPRSAWNFSGDSKGEYFRILIEVATYYANDNIEPRSWCFEPYKPWEELFESGELTQEYSRSLANIFRGFFDVRLVLDFGEDVPETSSMDHLLELIQSAGAGAYYDLNLVTNQYLHAGSSIDLDLNYQCGDNRDVMAEIYSILKESLTDVVLVYSVNNEYMEVTDDDSE